MDVLFWSAHLPCPTPSRIRECEKEEKPVTHEPRQRDDLMGRVRLFQQVRRSPVVSNKGRDLFSNTEVAAQISKHTQTDFHADQRRFAQQGPSGVTLAV